MIFTLDKSEKEACNLVAKASGEGRASPLVRPPSCGKDPYEPWDMTPKERDISTKYLRLINYHVHRRLNYWKFNLFELRIFIVRRYHCLLTVDISNMYYFEIFSPVIYRNSYHY